MVNIVILWNSLDFDSKPPSDSKICRCLSLLFLSTLSVVPNHFGTKDPLHGRQVFHGPSRENGFKMIHEHYIYCVLYFYDYYIAIYNDNLYLHPRPRANNTTSAPSQFVKH